MIGGMSIVYGKWQNISQNKKMQTMFIVEIGALLYDVADYKLHGGDEEIGPRTAREWLESLHVPDVDIEHVCNIIRHMSFKGAYVTSHMVTIEGKIIQDADRLDARVIFE